MDARQWPRRAYASRSPPISTSSSADRSSPPLAGVAGTKGGVETCPASEGRSPERHGGPGQAKQRTERAAPRPHVDEVEEPARRSPRRSRPTPPSSVALASPAPTWQDQTGRTSHSAGPPQSGRVSSMSQCRSTRTSASTKAVISPAAAASPDSGRWSLRGLVAARSAVECRHLPARPAPGLLRLPSDRCPPRRVRTGDTTAPGGHATPREELGTIDNRDHDACKGRVGQQMSSMGEARHSSVAGTPFASTGVKFRPPLDAL